MTTNPYLPKSEYRRLKMRLTKAINRHNREQTLDSARALEREARYGLNSFEDHYYPDDWSRWQRAEEDAIWWLRRNSS